ncbi:MAG: dihydrolipoamide acetyltransferase family protein [Pseudomonadota bacterium]
MSEFIFKLPDLGEGLVEAEIAKWHIEPGQVIDEDDPLVDMMTDKAAVEVASPVSGTVTALHGEAGAMVAVGSPLVTLQTDGAAANEDKPSEAPAAAAAETTAAAAATPAPAPAEPPAATGGGKVLTSPSIRKLAREQGIDLSQIQGTGPNGRIVSGDVDQFLSKVGGSGAPVLAKATGTEEIKVIGLRRAIAQRMAAAKRNVPHFSYVEEVDITALDELRRHLNATHPGRKLTYLPLFGAALIKVLRSFPQCNAVYDEGRNVIVRHAGVHLGIATQTDDGLKVPVVHHAEALNLWSLAQAMTDAAHAARSNRASRSQLTGSTITITSLGKLGGIASTPIINEPEVGIIGINKAVQRPMVVDGQVVVRLMMNISTSFDHRFVDGFDAAAMIQALKELLENPATIFIPEP